MTKKKVRELVPGDKTSEYEVLSVALVGGGGVSIRYRDLETSRTGSFFFGNKNFPVDVE